MYGWGVYCIENVITGDQYVGMTFDLGGRFKNHFTSLFTGKHRNERLQESYDKFGALSFRCYALQECGDERETREAELAWILKLRPKLNKDVPWIKKPPSKLLGRASPLKGRKYGKRKVVRRAKKSKTDSSRTGSGIPRHEQQIDHPPSDSQGYQGWKNQGIPIFSSRREASRRAG